MRVFKVKVIFICTNMKLDVALKASCAVVIISS